MKKYKIIYADPPWSYKDKSCNGNALDHYETMDIDSICSLPIENLTEKDCVLFLWATYPLLPEALRVINSWGFTYKTIAFQWIKLNKKTNSPFYGLGRWTRGNTEPCLLAVKGKPKRKSNKIFQLIHSPIQAHSTKPHIVREKIVELMGDLPRIELFARKDYKDMFGFCKHDGWDVWGNEVESDIKLITKNN